MESDIDTDFSIFSRSTRRSDFSIFTRHGSFDSLCCVSSDEDHFDDDVRRSKRSILRRHFENVRNYPQKPRKRVTLRRHDGTSYTDDGHRNTCMGEMETMRKNELLTDVVLTAGNREYHAHRIVLSSACEYFSIMFTRNMREARQSVININGVDPETLGIIIEYCYTGTIEINEHNAESILSAACLFQLQGIMTSCSAYLAQHIHLTNCVEMYHFADAHSCFTLRDAAEKFIADHFNEVRSSNDFLDLSYCQMKRLLSCEELNITMEEDTYHAVMDWIKVDESNRKSKIGSLLACVKLPLLSEKFLVDTVQQDPLISEDPACRELIREAVLYHLVPERRSEIQSNRTRPRQSTLENIYVLGGADLNKENLKMEMFHVRGNTWTYIGQPPSRRFQFGAALLSGKIHVTGGRDGLRTMNTVEYLDCHDEQGQVLWKALPSMLSNRHGHGVGVLQPDSGPLYAVGGRDNWSYLNTAERWDPRLKEWNFIACLSSPRSSAGVTVLNSKLYAVGGRDGSSCLQSVEVYDPYTDTWTSVASLSKRRAGIGVAALGGCLYAVGGFERNTRYKSVERYDPREGVWRRVSSMSIARDAVALAVLADRLVAIGGYDGTKYLNVTEIFDPVNNKWSTLSPLNFARAGASAIAVSRDQNDMLCKEIDALRMEADS